MVILNEEKDFALSWQFKILHAAQNDIIQVFACWSHKNLAPCRILQRLINFGARTEKN